MGTISWANAELKSAAAWGMTEGPFQRALISTRQNICHTGGRGGGTEKVPLLRPRCSVLRPHAELNPPPPLPITCLSQRSNQEQPSAGEAERIWPRFPCRYRSSGTDENYRWSRNSGSKTSKHSDLTQSPGEQHPIPGRIWSLCSTVGDYDKTKSKPSSTTYQINSIPHNKCLALKRCAHFWVLLPFLLVLFYKRSGFQPKVREHAK